MPTFFSIKELNEPYSWKDFEIGDLTYDYAIDAHDIPEEYIEDIEVSTVLRRIDISIIEDKSVIKEDWYQCLLKYAS